MNCAAIPRSPGSKINLQETFEEKPFTTILVGNLTVTVLTPVVTL